MEKLPFSPEKGKASTLWVCCISLLLKLLFKLSTPGRVKWINYITKILPRISKSRTEKYCFSSTFKLFSVLIWKTCDTRWIKSLYLASLEIIWEDNNWCSCKKTVRNVWTFTNWKPEIIRKKEKGGKSLSFSILGFESNNYRLDNSRFKWISFLFLTTTNFLDLQVLFPALFWVVFVYFMLQREKSTQLLKLRIRKYHW